MDRSGTAGINRRSNSCPLTQGESDKVNDQQEVYDPLLCFVRLIRWCDGAPQDLNQDQLWDEGVALVATRVGRSALEGVVGLLNIGVSRRSVGGARPSERLMGGVEQ